MNAMVPQKTKRPATHEPAEAPPLVKWIIWFFDRTNWQKYWKAIVIAFVVLSIGLIVKFVYFEHDSPITSSSPNSKYVSMPEEEVRKAIMTALRKGDLRNAIGYLPSLSETSAMREECEHVFNYCIKNGKFKECMLVVNLCWQGKKKEDKIRDIEHELYKQ